MTMMQCNDFSQYAEHWMEGERHPDAAAHVDACPRCRVLVADLEAIQAAATQLVEAEVEPPARVWTAIRAQLKSEGIIRSWRWQEQLAEMLQVLPRPALAGAYVAFLVVAAVLASFEVRTRREQLAVPSLAQTTLASAQTQLTTVEQHTIRAMHQHNPAVRVSLQDNLAIVDNFIDLCEKSVREQPQNELAREYLYGAYQQKAELLATLMDRGAMAE